MKFLLTSGCLILVAFGATYAQSPGPSREELEKICPKVWVDCPNNPKPNEPVSFTGKVSGGDPNVQPVYYWEISKGEIIEGQGTLVIKVNASDLDSLTGTLTVFGYNKKCSKTASCSTSPIHHSAPARKFDSYGRLTTQETNLRLDQFLTVLNNEPGAQGYILGYHDRSTKTDAAQKAIEDAKKYLIGLGVPDGRIVTLDGGLDDEFKVELWIVPAGSMPPLVPDPPIGGQSSKPEKP